MSSRQSQNPRSPLYELSSLSLVRCLLYLSSMCWHYSIHEVITSTYYILMSLDEYLVEMAKSFSARSCVMFLALLFNIFQYENNVWYLNLPQNI
jgi:hypothetical protein